MFSKGQLMEVLLLQYRKSETILELINTGEGNNGSLVAQLGWRNMSTVTQNGYGNISGVLQAGWDNTSTVTQTGNGHLSGVLQIGAGNMSTVTQTGGGPTLD